jgi:hypothetical protein
MVSFTSRPLYPLGKSPWYPLIGGWVGPRAVLDAVVKGKILIIIKTEYRKNKIRVNACRYTSCPEYIFTAWFEMKVLSAVPIPQCENCHLHCS